MLLLTFDIDPAVLAVAGIVGFVSFKWISNSTSRANRLLAKLPGPKPLPVIGNSRDITGGFAGFLETLHRTWPRVFGEIFCWYVGSQVNVTISSPELMETILKSQKILDKGVDYNWYHAWLEQGLLVSKGDKWRVRRRVLTPAFHFKILDDFVDVFNKQSRVLCRLLQERCQSPNGTLLDVYPLMTNCTLDIIGETATGTQLNAMIDGESKYAKAVHRMLRIITERTTKPWLANDFIFPLTPTGREHDHLLSILHSFIDDVIRGRREEIKKNPDALNNRNWKPLLDILLEASSDGQSMSDQDIREEIGTFMFGGHDTTSASMSWFLYLMAAHPEHQELVWEELKDTFGDEDRDVTVEDIPNLKYLDYCIKESLRMYPAAPLIERMATEEIQLGDYTIPAGSNILMLIYGMHRNPRIFPDPDKFDPERFFPEQCIGRHPFAYIPFSAGPRNCIGQRFALTEQKVVLSNLLRRFKFELSPETPKPIPSYQVVLKPLNGMNLVLTPRQ